MGYELNLGIHINIVLQYNRYDECGKRQQAARLPVPSLSDRPCVEYSLQRPGALPQSLTALAPGNMTSVCTDWCQEKDTTAL